MSNGIILDVPEISLTSKSYQDMTLPELLELRDKIVKYKADMLRLENGKEMFKFAMGRIQSFIYLRRTHRKSGLVIPYDKDITTD